MIGWVVVPLLDDPRSVDLSLAGFSCAVASQSGGVSHLTLGPRALLELGTYIKSRAGEEDDTPVCPVCSQIAIVGKRCDSCMVKLCRPCLTTLLSKAEESKRCAICQPIPVDVYVPHHSLRWILSCD